LGLLIPNNTEIMFLHILVFIYLFLSRYFFLQILFAYDCYIYHKIKKERRRLLSVWATVVRNTVPEHTH